MKAFIVQCLIVCLICGCTTLHPIANAPSDLSQRFGDGGALQPGDQVIIKTVTGTKHGLRVSSVSDGVIYGDHDSVPFSEIASIDRREFSAAKTALLVVGIAGIVGVIAALASAAAHAYTGAL